MKTTVEIPDPLLAETKKVAAKEGVTLRALVEEGLRRTLDERRRRKAFKLRQIVFGGKGRRRDLKSWDRIRDLLYEGRGA